MAQVADMVRELTYTTGNGLTLTLAGAVAGYAAFSSATNITDGTEVYYEIKNGSNIESGIGTWRTGNLLDRTMPYFTLVAGVVDDTSPSKITLAGSSEVMISLSAKVVNDLLSGTAAFASPPELGSTTPAAVNATTLSATGDVSVSKTITAPATTGVQIIDKTAGSVNFAAAASSLAVTNSLVTTNSVIIATVATNDATMLSVQAVAGSGSFEIFAKAPPTAETRVNFLVVN